MKRSPGPATLRRRAQARLRSGTPPAVLSENEGDLRRLVHELQVHQVELELQNEELRRAKEALEESHARYADLFDFAPVGYFTLDRAGTILAANLRGASLLGVERSRLPGRSLGFFVDQGTRAALGEFLGRVFAAQGPESCEASLAAVDGRALRVRIKATALARGGECNAALIDLTDVRRAEAELRASEGKYHAVFENILDAVFLTSPDGSIYEVNDAACRMFGRTREELLRGGRGLIVDASDPRLRPALEERARTGAFRGELTYLRSDGSRFPGAVSSSLFTDAGGESRTAMTIRDVTELKAAFEGLRRHEAELQELAAELTVAEERERRRIASVLHDAVGQSLALARIRLGVIGAQAEAGGRPEGIEEVRGVLDQAIGVTRTLTSDLASPILYEFGLRAALERLGEDLCRASGLSFEFVDDGATTVLDEALQILVSRAAQEVLVNTVKRSKGRVVRLGVESPPGGLRVCVEDDGVGMPPGWALGLRGGTGGLGLFSIQERLRHRGGTLEVRPRAEGGTSVALRVPFPPREPREAGA